MIPHWRIVLIVARAAQRLYAPLGTELSLGEYVRLNQRFVDLFAHKKRRTISSTFTPRVEHSQFNFDSKTSETEGYAQTPPQIKVDEDDADTIDALARDLKVTLPSAVTVADNRHAKTSSPQKASRTTEYEHQSTSNPVIYTGVSSSDLYTPLSSPYSPSRVSFSGPQSSSSPADKPTTLRTLVPQSMFTTK